MLRKSRSVGLAVFVAVVAMLPSLAAFCQSSDDTLPPGPLQAELGGMRFEVPRLYLVSPYVARQTEPWTLSPLGIAFWISDRKPPAKMPIELAFLQPEFWPQEAGRPRGGTSDFVVNVMVRQRKPGPGGKWVHPSGMAAVTLSNGHWLGEETVASAFGLECHEFKPRDYPGKTYFKMCTTPPKASPEVYLVTSWREKAPDTPYWRMDAWSESDGLSLNLFFPEQALDRWREIVDAAFALVRSWRATR